MTRGLPPLFLWCATLLVPIPLASGQTSLNGITASTPPARIAELAWDAVTVKCKRPELPTASVFFSYIETEFLGRDTPESPAGSVVAVRKRVVEYRVSNAAQVHQEHLEEADRLNGFEWSGHSDLPATSSRDFVSISPIVRSGPQYPNAWGPWISMSGLGAPLTMDMVLKNGKWNIRFHGVNANIDNLVGSDLHDEVKFLGCPGGPCKNTMLDRRIKMLPCSKLLSANPLPDGGAAVNHDDFSNNPPIAHPNYVHIKPPMGRYTVGATTDAKAEAEAQAKLNAAAEASILARRNERVRAEQAAEVTIPASEFEPRLRDAVKSRVQQVFSTDASRYEDGIQKLSNLVQTCAGISPDEFGSRYIDPSRVPDLWSIAGGKYGYCEQYYIRTIRMREGVKPGQTPNVPLGAPGLVFHDTLRKNWNSGAWSGPKFRIEVFLDSSESYNLGPGGPSNAKYIVMIANITE
jgi:hypothetical protein